MTILVVYVPNDEFTLNTKLEFTKPISASPLAVPPPPLLYIIDAKSPPPALLIYTRVLGVFANIGSPTTCNALEALEIPIPTLE